MPTLTPASLGRLALLVGLAAAAPTRRRKQPSQQLQTNLFVDALEQRTAPGGFRIYATGWQKSGSTAMTVALGDSLGESGVEYATEAVQGCCCGGTACSDLTPVPAAECANQTDLTADLWRGDMEAYVTTCSGIFEAQLLKADDMVWQIDQLMDYAAAQVPPSPTANMQFIFYVRHPLFNVRSLLAWCAPSGTSDSGLADGCTKEQLDARETGSNNTLYMRIFAHQGTNGLATDPISLAATWREAANVYLRDPSRFAALLRYEDMVRDPATQATRVLSAAYARYVSIAGTDLDTTVHIDGDAAFEAMGGNTDLTPTGDYDHDVPANELFDEATSEAICTMLGAEMDAFGYTAEGVDESFDYDSIEGVYLQPTPTR